MLEERAALNVSYTYNVEEQMDEMLESLADETIKLIGKASVLTDT